MTTVLSHGPLQTDVPDIRPTLQGSVGTATRVSLVAAGAAAGAGLALVATPSATTALTTAVIGAGLVTSLAANWSTCGMSVAELLRRRSKSIGRDPRLPSADSAGTLWVRSRREPSPGH